MADDRDNELDTTQQDFDLDDILAEFSSSRTQGGDASVPRQRIPVTREAAPEPPEPPRAEPPAPKAPEEEADKIIRFPGSRKPEPAREPENDSVLGRLLKKADDYSAQMFQDAEPTPEERKAEHYMPGVDTERPEQERKIRLPRRRRIRQQPDLPLQELAARYGHGLGALRARRFLVFLLALPLIYLHLSGPLDLPLPSPLAAQTTQIWICAGVLLLALLLSCDLIFSGFTHLGADTLIVLAGFATLADACTIALLHTRDGMPYSLICIFALGFGLWGRYMDRLTRRAACRTAHAAKTPYLVTLDENKWDGRAVFSKWSGSTEGFGSQIQGEDGAARAFRPAAGLLILACVLFATVASAGRGRGELFFWCLSAMLCVAASFSSTLAFSLPARLLSRRLTGLGAALAGWEGIRRQAKNAGILLTDTDLFPPGAISMNGVKVFQNHPLDKVISVTATVIRGTGSGLDRVFHELLRSQGTVYRKAEDLQCLEGGACAVIRGEHVMVGSAAFMHMMEVTLPQGLNVKNAVFCAIEGQLAGIFALNYALHATVRPSLSALIENRISPILATRDFNLIPAMLRQRFKLPAEKMEFPEQSRRRALSDPEQEHDLPLVCVLCREGIGPLSETVVGARRLCLATRINTALSLIGSVVGVLITFYLTAQAAFASLSVSNMLVFLLMWLVPTLLISGWVNRY